MFWRHVVASSRPDETGSPSEQAGSQGYQAEHMGLIFQEGLSFSGFERDRLFVGDGSGAFADLSGVSGADDENDGRAVVVADFDDDGDPDVFVHNIARSRHRLYRNDAGRGGWVKVRLQGVRVARDAAGAVVRLALDDGRQQAQVQALGSGFISQNAPELIFGLGAAGGGVLHVTWPGGEGESFGPVQAGARVLLVQGSGVPRPLKPVTFVFPDGPPPGLKADVGDRLTGLTLHDPSGETFELDLTSKGETWLNLWASWCAGCLAEIGDLEALHRQPGQRVVAVGLDDPARRRKAESLLRRKGATYPCAFAGPEAVERLLDLDRLTLPTTLRLAPDGTILQIVRGPVTR